MIPIIIADDDIEMLEGLTGSIRWEYYGFEVVGTAPNGEAALDLLREKHPLVLLTDITMPRMNGLNLIRQARTIVPDLKTIILTCHEDFHYARTAVDLGVLGYVTKLTLTEPELAKYLEKAKRQIEEDVNHNPVVNIQKSAEKIISSQDLSPSWLRYPNDCTEYRIIFTWVNDSTSSYKTDIQAMTERYNKIMKKLPDNFSHPVFLSPREVIIFFWKTESTNQRIEKLRETAGLIAEDMYDPYMMTSLMTCISSFRNIDIPFRDAVADLKEYRKNGYYAEGIIISTEDRLRGKKFTKSSLFDFLKFNSVVETKNRSRVKNFLSALFKEMEQTKPSPEQARNFERRCILLLRSKSEELSINSNYLREQSDSFTGMKNNLNAAVDSYIENARQIGIVSSRHEINWAVKYIYDHISESLTIEQMADKINKSQAYFSRLFAKETGTSFSSFLLETRMQKARKLLSTTDLTIDEVSRSIGFEDPSYFYRVFKKKNGVTPKQYRK